MPNHPRTYGTSCAFCSSACMLVLMIRERSQIRDYNRLGGSEDTERAHKIRETQSKYHKKMFSLIHNLHRQLIPGTDLERQYARQGDIRDDITSNFGFFLAYHEGKNFDLLEDKSE